VVLAVWRAILVTALLAALSNASIAGADPSSPWVEEILSPQYFAAYVADVDKSVEWYCTVFGLKKLGGSSAEDGSWRIENLGSEKLAVEIIYDSRAQEVDRALGFRKIGFYVKDIEAVARRVERETGEKMQVLDFAELGQRILQLRDPDGNIVQLFSLLEER